MNNLLCEHKFSFLFSRWKPRKITVGSYGNCGFCFKSLPKSSAECLIYFIFQLRANKTLSASSLALGVIVHICYLLSLLSICHFRGDVLIHCYGFNLHFPVTNDINHITLMFISHLCILLIKCPFIYFGHFHFFHLYARPIIYLTHYRYEVVWTICFDSMNELETDWLFVILLNCYFIHLFFTLK